MTAELSITLIAKNEEQNLPRLFSSLAILRDELKDKVEFIYVDTGSLDKSKYIAQDFGAQCFEFPWINDFSAARNFGIQHCEGKWVFWVDADDEIPLGTSRYIIDLVLGKQAVGNFCAIRFLVFSPRQNGNPVQFSQTRIFPGNLGIFFDYPIHESLTPSLEKKGIHLKETDHYIIHHGYFSEATLVQKTQRNKAFLERLIQSQSGSYTHKYTLARTYHVENDLGKALGIYKSILEDAQVWSNQSDVALATTLYMGQALGMLGKLTEAQRLFELFSNKGQDHCQFLFEWGKISFIMGNTVKARSLFLKAKQIGPKNWSIPTDWSEVVQGLDTLLQKLEPGDTLPISLCMIVKNEKQNLLRLFQEIPHRLFEWILVDTGSTDGTLDLLQDRNIPYFQIPWEGDFSKARNFSLEKASRPYILWLDADDHLPIETLNWLQRINTKEQQCYRLIIESPKDNGTRENARQIRVFPNFLGIQFHGAIHENLGKSVENLKLTCIDVPFRVIHQGYYHHEARQQKTLRNLQLLQKKWDEGQKDLSIGIPLGNCFFQLQDYSKAIDQYRICSQLSDFTEESKSLPRRIGDAFLALGNIVEAEKEYHHCLQLNPHDTESLYSLGKLYLNKGDSLKSIEFFELLISKMPEIKSEAGDEESRYINSWGFLVLMYMSFPDFKNQEKILAGLSVLEKNLDRLPFSFDVPVEFYITSKNWEKLDQYIVALSNQSMKDISWIPAVERQLYTIPNPSKVVLNFLQYSSKNKMNVPST